MKWLQYESGKMPARGSAAEYGSLRPKTKMLKLVLYPPKNIDIIYVRNIELGPV